MGAIVSLVAVLAAAAVAAFAATLFWALVARPAQRDPPREVGSARTAG